MKKYIVIVLGILNFSLFSINIKLDRVIDRPSFSEYNDEVKEFGKNISGVSISSIIWVSKTEILLKGFPLYFIIDIDDSSFTRQLEFSDRFKKEYSSFSRCIRSDYVLFSSGDPFNFDFSIYSVDFGFKPLKSLEVYKELVEPIKATGDSIFEKAVSWEYNLLGEHKIIPGPKFNESEYLVYDFVEYGLSLVKNGEDDLIILPEEYFGARNVGNSSLTTVSFDKFRIALYSDVALKNESDFGNRSKVISAFFILNVEYDGYVYSNTYLKADPSFDSEDVELVTKDTKLLVTDADNYEVRSNNEEDFWYYIEADTASGWVFGGDLIVEGENWQDRLRTRGRPLDWNLITEDGDFLGTSDIVVDVVEESELKTEPQVSLEDALTKVPLNSETTGKQKTDSNDKWNTYILAACTFFALLAVILIIKRVTKKNGDI